MTDASTLPPPIRRYLGAFVARRRAVAALAAAGSGCAVAVGWALACCLADRVLRLPGAARATLLVAGAVLAAAMIWRPLAGRVLARTDWVAAAADVEARTALFGERLQTVTSQLTGPPGYRGSEQMLRGTVAQVGAEAAAARAGPLVPWRAGARPWAACALLLVLAAALWPVAWLDMPRLLGRFLRPMAKAPPVAVTRLTVSPQGADLAPGEQVRIEALAAPVDARGVTLMLSNDGRTWSRVPMTPDGADRFSYLLPALDRDLFYSVRGGDAASDAYALRLKRVPAAAEFRVRYTFPRYTGHAPLVVTNTDGLVEGVVGCDAEITVVATEPLAGADLVMGGTRYPMLPGPRPNERVATITLWQDDSFAVRMTSAAGVEGLWSRGGERGGEHNVRALPDRPPIVRIIEPADDLRLGPRDAVTLRFEALDDFGIASVEAAVRLNAAAAAVFPVPLAGQPLRKEGEFTFDLSDLAPRVGDVVQFSFRVRDLAAHTYAGEVRRVLVAPASVGPAAYARARELRRAALLAKSWGEALDRARAALEQARGQNGAKQEPWARANRALADAAELGLLLRQSLLRAIGRSDAPPLSAALAAVVDETATPVVDPGRVLSPAARADDAALARAATRAARARELAARLNVVAQGQTAGIALAEWANRKAVEAAEPLDKLAAAQRDRALERARLTLDNTLRELNLARDQPGLDGQLRARIRAEQEWVAAPHAVDLRPAIREWLQRLRASGAVASEVPARLAAAAQAEAMRPDADLVGARDLQLAARAASAVARLVSQARDGQRPGGKPLDRLPEAARDFEAAYAAVLADRPPAGTPRGGTVASPEQARAARVAGEARARLVRWAAEPDLSSLPAAEVPARVEDIALAASALGLGRDHERQARLDGELAGVLAAASPDDAARFAADVSRAMALARQYADWADRQDQLRADQVGTDVERRAEAQQLLASTLDAAIRATDAAATTQPAPVIRDPGDASLATPPTAEQAARDPLAAAAWHARAAADGVLHQRGDPRAEQQLAATLLRTASDQALHRAAARRLASLPSYAALFESAGETPGDFAMLAAMPQGPGVPRDWGASVYRLLSGLGQPREAEPAGYSDSLKAYFDAIARARDERGRQ